MDQETQAVIKFCLAKGYLTQSTLHALLTRYQELQKQGECNFFALLAQSLRWTQEQLQAVIKASLAADSTGQCQATANQTTQVHQQSVADISKEDYLFAREIVFRGMLNIEVVNHQLAEKYSTEEGKAMSLSQYLLRKRLIDMDDFIKIRKDLSSNESLDSPLPGIELKIIYSKGLPQLQQTKNLQKIAKYEIIREIGRGGMGIVYAVQDKELDRIVALKTLFHSESEVNIERFQREARLAASLRHPNIITVYDTGVWQNIHYFTMDYVDGIAISDYVQNIKPNIEEIVTMMRDIASALSLAHSKNVIHRDLKPGNILVDTHGVAHLGDFGLARELKGEKQLTLSGAIIGTPAYMPPEQAIGNLKAVDKRSDIYSFGAVLYELLVGRPPLTGATLAQSIAAITEQDPIAPRKLVKGLDIELETICLKCLEKNPQRRYPNGKALLADLDRYLKGEVIQARPASFLYKTSKLFSRNKMVASLSALCLSIIMVIIYLLVLSPGTVTLLLPDKNIKILIDDHHVATGRLNRHRISRGYHRVKLLSDSYSPDEFLVHISPGEEIKLEKQLLPLQGKISISANSTEIRAHFTHLKSNKKYDAIVPIHQLPLNIGEYQIEFRKDNHFMTKSHITIVKEMQHELRVEMEPMLIWRREVGDDAHLNSMHIADIDRSGQSEIVVTNNSGSISCYTLENHKLTWRLENQLPYDYTPVELYDINRDGYLDFIIANYHHFFIIDGKTREEIFNMPNFWGWGYELADVNGDGYDDLVLLRCYTSSACYDLRNNQKVLWSNGFFRAGIGGKLRLGQQLIVSDKGRLLLLDLATGRLSTFVTFGGNVIPSSLKIADNKKGQRLLIVYSDDKGVMGIRMDNAQIVWQFEQHPFYDALLTIHDIDGNGTIEALIHLDALYCLDAMTGKLQWKCETSNKITGLTIHLADLDRDGVLEIFSYSNDGYLYRINLSGQILGKYKSDMISSLIPMDVDGDGDKEILLLTANGYIDCVSFTQRRDIKKFSIGKTTWSLNKHIKDIDGDGGKEFLFVDYDQKVSCWNLKKWQLSWAVQMPQQNCSPYPVQAIGHRKGGVLLTGNSKIWMLDSAGKTQWQKDLAVTVRACDDIDNSNTQTIIASSDNIFYAIHADDGKIRWQNDMVKCISSTPVIIDLDNNGRKEIVCASSITFQSPNEYYGLVYCLEATTGRIIWAGKIPCHAEGRSELGFGDCNGDGILDIFVCQIGGYISALDGRNGQTIWQRRVRGGNLKDFPIVRDFDRDGRKEIVFVTEANDIYCLDCATGETRWYRTNNPPINTIRDISMARGHISLIDLGQDMDGDNIDDLLVSTWKSPICLLSGKEGNWISDSIRFGKIQSDFVIDDIDQDGKKDLFFIDQKYQGTCIFDIVKFCSVMSLAPIHTGWNASSSTLWQAHIVKLFERGSYQRMAQDLNKFPWLLPEHFLALYQGIHAITSQQEDRALQFLKKASQLAPESMDSKILAALIFLNRSSNETAQGIFVKLLQNSIPQFDRVLRKYQRILTNKGQENLYSTLKNAVRITRCDLKLDQIWQYENVLNERQDSLFFLELTLKYSLPETPNHNQRIERYFKSMGNALQSCSSKYQEHNRFEIFDHAVNILPDHPEILAHRGHNYFITNFSYDLAQKDIERSLSLEPKQPALLMVNAQIHYIYKRYSQAIASCQKALSLKPDSIIAHLTLAFLYVANKENEQAKKILKQAETLNPDNAERYMLEYIKLIAHGTILQARQWLKQQILLTKQEQIWLLNACLQLQLPE